MKLLILLSFFISTSTFAANICSFEQTWQFEEALERKRIKPSKQSSSYRRFTFLEKQMIHLTVTLQDWLKGASREEALKIFSDVENGRSGSLAGEISYYRISGREFALVRYYPGDNEYGAYFELKNRAFRLIARIDDTEITCKK